MSYTSTVLTGLAFVVAGSLPFVAIARDGAREPRASAGTVAAPTEVGMGEMWVKAATPRAGRIAFSVVNDGAVAHALAVDGHEPRTGELAAGERATLDVGEVAAGTTLTLYCPVPGHREAGMVTEVTVGGSTAPDGHSGHGAPGPDGKIDFEAMDKAMKERTALFPAKTKGLGGQPLAPRVLADGTKQFDVTAKVVDWEVEPGKVVQAWTYNGQVPGPTMRVDVGDKVRIVLTNELPESTAIHLHGVRVPNAMDGVPDITQEAVKPGETFTYEFTPDRIAVGMYHSHHNAVAQVPNGLAGTFLVGDMPLPKGVKVAQDLPMMLNDAGVIGFSLNGKSFPATAPIVAARGEWVQVHYLNEGAMAHPMHLHGLDQLVIAKDGYPVAKPYYEDTIMVGPGERFTILVKAELPGTWAWHCHILSHAENEKGMFGMVTAMVVT